jgi:protein-S-isoprenylcysteine O-methyltransferase Ste14
MVVSAAVTVAVLAVVFVGIFPKVADYSDAWTSIQVWRAATYVPQVLLGALTFLWWRVTASHRREG